MQSKSIPWHHMDSDYVPFESSRTRKWFFRIVKEPATYKSEGAVKEIKRAALNEDPFVFGNVPFDNK
jgi:hypothetical protein